MASTSNVADITRIRKSGRSARRTSTAIAKPRSHESDRSWNSSNTRSPTSASSGSDTSRCASSPSVTISSRVRADTLRSNRTWKPTVSPTFSPSLRAMYAAQLRAASLRGSNMRIFFPIRNGASRSADGTQVVLPLPGGARNTTSRFLSNESRICGSIVSTGNMDFMQTMYGRPPQRQRETHRRPASCVRPRQSCTRIATELCRCRGLASRGISSRRATYRTSSHPRG